MERTDYDAMARVYDVGRAMPEESVAEWRSALERSLAGIEGPIADIGSGTGIWASFIADWFALEVVAIEPSQGMRQRAIEHRPHNLVSYVGGEAEHLPLRDSSCGAIWMSTVVHHFSDLEGAAHEARRVLHDGGPLLIRNPFVGRHDDILWTRVFPSALRLAERRHPEMEVVVDAFAAAGLQQQEARRVTEIAAADLHEYARKIATRADSTLVLISDEDFELGLAELRRMAAESPPEPVTTTLDLLVLR